MSHLNPTRGRHEVRVNQARRRCKSNKVQHHEKLWLKLKAGPSPSVPGDIPRPLWRALSATTCEMVPGKIWNSAHTHTRLRVQVAEARGSDLQVQHRCGSFHLHLWCAHRFSRRPRGGGGRGGVVGMAGFASWDSV